MRVAVVHGYFLHDSGSGTYVRHTAEALARDGHDVTLVCQERSPELYDFIDSAYAFEAGNDGPPRVVFEREPRFRGCCRFVRPCLDRLLVFVEGAFPGFPAARVRAFQDAPVEWIDAYVEANVRALRSTLATWPVDVVLAHHAIMQPHAVRSALAGKVPYTVTVHGSELSFSLRRDARLAAYGRDGLEGAAAIVALSPASAEDVVDWARSAGIDLRDKTVVLPPGVDGELFAPAADRGSAVAALHDEGIVPPAFDLAPEDDVIVFAGRLKWTKGAQHMVCALPLIAGRRPGVRLLVAGEGAGREPLARLVSLLEAGDLEAARALVEGEEELASPSEYGPVVPAAAPLLPRGRLAFLGHLPQSRLARVFAAADVAAAPSVFPEALGQVNVEALSAGATPLATHQTGTAAFVDVVADALGDPALRRLVPGRPLTDGLADLAVHVLDSFPTRDPAYRSRLHGIAAAHYPPWSDIARHHLELGGGVRQP